MKVDVLLGLQWGDEGKGKVVDVLTPNYDVVTRFQGGPNAGHTLEFNGEKYVLRSIPSGIFQGGKINVIGNGVVLDPLLFKQEAESLAASGHDITKQLYISNFTYSPDLGCRLRGRKRFRKDRYDWKGYRPDLYG